MAHHDTDDAATFDNIVHAYTRADAIADGLLVDVTPTARESGFSVPVALTEAAWLNCVAWTDADTARQVTQDEAGRLWGVLWMAKLAARRAGGADVVFELHGVPRGGRGTRPRSVQLRMVIGPGDEGEPVIPILMPGED